MKYWNTLEIGTLVKVDPTNSGNSVEAVKHGECTAKIVASGRVVKVVNKKYLDTKLVKVVG